MSTSDGEDASQADVEPLPASYEEDLPVRLSESSVEAEDAGDAGKDEEEGETESGPEFSFECSVRGAIVGPGPDFALGRGDFDAAGRLVAERVEAEMSDGGGSDSETEEATTIVDAAPPIEPLDPFKAFDDEDDLRRLSGVIDTWGSGLKQQLAAEFSSAKQRLSLISRGAVANHHSELSARERGLLAQIASLRAEAAAERREAERRRRVAERVGAEAARQREKARLAAAFAQWRIALERDRRERFCAAIAERHYRRALKRRVFRAWASSLAGSLSAMLERRCRLRAEEVCARLASEHEERVAAINRQLDVSRSELAAALTSQAAIREEVRAALVKGVSALNSDPKKSAAPGAFDRQEEKEEREEKEEAREEDEEDDRATYTLSDDSSEREKIIIATAPQRRVTTGVVLRAQAPTREPRSASRQPISAPAVGLGAVFHHDLPPGYHRPIAGQEPLPPAPARPRRRSPVASVLVERRHAVNKRTAASAVHSRRVKA